MVGMDPVDAKARGVLGVMSDQQTESPEEQYDRLVRLSCELSHSSRVDLSTLTSTLRTRC